MRDRDFPHFLSRMLGMQMERHVTKALMLGKMTPRGTEESRFKCICDSCAFLHRSLRLPFTQELVRKAYFLLACADLGAEDGDSVALAYLSYADDVPATQAMYVLEALRKAEIGRFIEFACLIVNHIYERKGLCLTIRPAFYGGIVEGLTDERKTYAMLLEQAMVSTSRKGRKRPHRIVPREEIVSKIVDDRLDLMNGYKVEKMWLYGSYADGTFDQGSDVDLLVRFFDGVTNMEQTVLIDKLKKHVQELVGMPVDILSQGYAYRRLDISAITHAKTLI